MIKKEKIGNYWKNNLTKRLNKNSNSSNFQINFQSIESGKNLLLEECLFDDILPYSLATSPVSSIEANDNLWIASSMLARVSDTTDNLVVIENDFPIGTLSIREILNAILKNPTPYLFHDSKVSQIMNRKFYLDIRKTKLQKLLKQITQSKKSFAIIQNKENDFSSFTFREILEIGALCTTNVKVSDLPDNKIKIFKRDDNIENIIRLLLNDETELLMLENESYLIDHLTILEKITGDLDYLQDIDNFLDLSASTFKLENPKLIPDKLSISEVCKTMLYMKHPFVMTSNRIITPNDILHVLSNGLDNP